MSARALGTVIAIHNDGGIEIGTRRAETGIDLGTPTVNEIAVLSY
jgi:hypothetical protein